MADEYIDKVEAGAKIQMMYIRREMDYGGENDFCRGMRKAFHSRSCFRWMHYIPDNMGF